MAAGAHVPAADTRGATQSRYRMRLSFPTPAPMNPTSSPIPGLSRIEQDKSFQLFFISQ